jgi:prophage regulatory protein
MTSPSKKMLRVSDIADWLNVSKSTVYKWVKEGNFPEPIILGEGDRSAASRWPLEDVQAWLDSRPRGVQGDGADD